jgi:hypothetical protein
MMMFVEYRLYFGKDYIFLDMLFDMLTLGDMRRTTRGALVQLYLLNSVYSAG